jgi:hypothetical protein
MDVLDEADLKSFWTGDFFEKVKIRFNEMGQSFRAEVENL